MEDLNHHLSTVGPNHQKLPAFNIHWMDWAFVQSPCPVFWYYVPSKMYKASLIEGWNQMKEMYFGNSFSSVCLSNITWGNTLATPALSEATISSLWVRANGFWYFFLAFSGVNELWHVFSLGCCFRDKNGAWHCRGSASPPPIPQRYIWIGWTWYPVIIAPWLTCPTQLQCFEDVFRTKPVSSLVISMLSGYEDVIN